MNDIQDIRVLRMPIIKCDEMNCDEWATHIVQVQYGESSKEGGFQSMRALCKKCAAKSLRNWIKGDSMYEWLSEYNDDEMLENFQEVYMR